MEHVAITDQFRKLYSLLFFLLYEKPCVSIAGSVSSRCSLLHMRRTDFALGVYDQRVNSHNLLDIFILVAHFYVSEV